jgi:hypothetical protein
MVTFCLKHVEKIADNFPVDTSNLEALIQTAMTTLGSTMTTLGSKL